MCTAVFTETFFMIAKAWKQPKGLSTDERIKKRYIYTMKYYSAINNNEIMPFAAIWTDLEIFILSEVSQTAKDKYIRYCLYVESEKVVDMNLLTKQN